jgi:hypothetical protein
LQRDSSVGGNIQHRTPNAQHSTNDFAQFLGGSMLDVGRWMFPLSCALNDKFPFP